MSADERETAGRRLSYMGDDNIDSEAVTYVELRPDEFGGPFWDDEGCLGDDWDMWESLGLTRETYDACMSWSGDQGEKNRLLRMLRAQLPSQVSVESPTT